MTNTPVIPDPTAQHPAGHYVTVTYAIVTPESAEQGDVAEQGWIDDVGESLEPDDSERADGYTPVHHAYDYLWRMGASQPSTYGPNMTEASVRGTWYTCDSHQEDYQTGGIESRSYHLHGFTPAEELELYNLVCAWQRPQDPTPPHAS